MNICIHIYTFMYVHMYVYKYHVRLSTYIYIYMYISALHLLALSCARCRVSTLAVFHRNIRQHPLVQIRAFLHYDVFTRTDTQDIRKSAVYIHE